jgi:hypothetical protein
MLSYTDIPVISVNPALLQQVETAMLKYAINRIAASVSGNELAFANAIVKAPATYAPRFVLVALILNAATLTSTNHTSLDTAVSDAALDAVIATQWQGQVSAGA